MKISILSVCILLASTFTALSQDILIKNINLVDVETGEIQPNSYVTISDGLITDISISTIPVTSISANKVIDGTGKYLVPGFIDTHVHIAIGPVGVAFEDGTPTLFLTLDDEITVTSLELLLEHGITTTRDPGGLTEITVSAKNRIKSGEIKGPELFVAGSIIDTLNFKNLTAQVKTDEEIREEILRQKNADVDMVKLYTSLSPAQLKTGVDYAHSLGLKTVSHLQTTSWTDAANLGLDNIVHIIPGNAELLPEEHRQAYRQFEMFGAIAFYKWFEYVDLKSKEIADMIDALVENQVSVDPTLVPFHAAFFGDKNIYQTNPKLKLIPASLVENWHTTFNFNLGWKEKDFEVAQASWSKVEELLRMLHDAGILLTAGTDANNPWMVPGDSFHDELRLFSEAGFTNSEILKIATFNGAKLIGIEDRVGLIKKGFEADLVILDENPLEDITATETYSYIISNGGLINE